MNTQNAQGSDWPAVVVEAGDLAQEEVDAIVNPADHKMRGGTGLDGAIHQAAGPEVLEECIDRFPSGLCAGAAGYTTAGELHAKWIIHTATPNYLLGESNPALLASCYRRSLRTADELGVRSISFPLLGSGGHGWPLRSAIKIAVRAILETSCDLQEIRLISPDHAGRIRTILLTHMLLNVLEGVHVLHQRGFEQIRIEPGMSASGVAWRLAIWALTSPPHDDCSSHVEDNRLAYSSAEQYQFLDTAVSVRTSAETFANLVLSRFPGIQPLPDPEYALWYTGLLEVLKSNTELPVSYSDSYTQPDGWEIGWGTGITYPEPPV